MNPIFKKLQPAYLVFYWLPILLDGTYFSKTVPKMLKRARGACDFGLKNKVLLLFGDEAQTFLCKS